MNKELLIVEDSPTQLEQLRYILEQNGYNVRTAREGKSAYDMILESKPALVISDIVMPEMNGYELCTKIKESPDLKDISVMLLTNLSDPQDVIKGLQAGADNFLTKPYNEYFLLSRISYILLNKDLRDRSSSSDMGIHIVFGGEKYFINSDRMQIIDLLLSTYENAIQKNSELAEANKQLLNMHREIARKNIELEKLNEDKNKFLRIAAHDLRNPTSAILSFSVLMMEEIWHKLDENEKEFLTIIKDSSEFVLKLLNELLDVAVIESGNLSLNLEETDIVALTEKNVSLNRVIADKKKLKIVFTPEVPELRLSIDAVKTEQILNNLISNAIKFSYPEKLIEVSLSKNEDQCVIKVTDQGQGIPPEDLVKLFQPFARRSVRSTAGERSTGLGLSIVKKIVEGHKGKIWVESEVGVGTTFFVSLPL
ncbi:MAG: hybrid sensor histidine kinase/response regulator [Ignavibacteriales bacterium]|nr:Sensor histidine kinase RcsC [Ignavibacteriaceae bacterium]MCK6614965.1 hybrid sensor histidine kinase/response regulator [Ignavibacteriaceae bacterium]QOJ29946.1 MAG: hybrid sensor histidine kinase/response regulator [Ignavibacteriales bacterium]